MYCQCDKCKYFSTGKEASDWNFEKGISGVVCKAFPRGIPTKYTSYCNKDIFHPGGIPHDTINPEQEGDYVFEMK